MSEYQEWFEKNPYIAPCDDVEQMYQAFKARMEAESVERCKNMTGELCRAHLSDNPQSGQYKPRDPDDR